MRKLLFAALTGALTMAALPADAEVCINGMEKHRKPTEKPLFAVDISLAEAELSASINENALVSAFRAQASANGSCLTNHRVPLTDGAEEQVTLSLVVGPNGTVTESNVLASSYHGQDFQACVDSSAQNMSFGLLRSGKSEKIYVTIRFQASEVVVGSRQILLAEGRQIDLAEAELSASINENALFITLMPQASALSTCLTKHRVRLTDGAKEPVTLSLVVAPSGTVTESNVLASSYRGERFQRCVDRASRKMNFGCLRSGKSEKIYITIGFRATEIRPRETGGASPASSPSRGTSAPANRQGTLSVPEPPK